MQHVKPDGRWRTVLSGLCIAVSTGACVTTAPAITERPTSVDTAAPSVVAAPSVTLGATASPTSPLASSPTPPLTASPTLAATGTPALTATLPPTPSASVPVSPPAVSPSPSQDPSPSPSPATGPSATPTTGAFGAVTALFQDDFADTPSGWGIGQRDNGAIDYQAEGLLVDLTAPTAGLWSTRLLGGAWPVVQIAGTVQPVDSLGADTHGYAGFLCAAGQQDYFMGLIDSRGGWVFAESVDTSVSVLARGGPPPAALAVGSSARLTMQCAGSETGAVRLRLLVEGQEVARFERAEGLLRFDQVGIYGEAIDPSFSFTVDDVGVWGGSEFVEPPASSPEARPSPAP